MMEDDNALDKYKKLMEAWKITEDDPWAFDYLSSGLPSVLDSDLQSWPDEPGWDRGKNCSGLIFNFSGDQYKRVLECKRGPVEGAFRLSDWVVVGVMGLVVGTVIFVLAGREVVKRGLDYGVRFCKWFWK